MLKLLSQISKCDHLMSDVFWNDLITLSADSVPLILSSLIQVFFTMISIAFCGFIGTNELDAGSLATSIINVAVFANVNGLTSAADTLFPQIYGGRDKKLVGLVLQKGIIISLLSSLLSAAMLMIASKLLIPIIDSPEILKLTDDYLITYIPTIIFYSISTLLSKYLQSQNIIYPTMFLNVISIIINFILHYHFIIDLDMGVIGAARAVNASTLLLMCLLLSYIYFNQVYIETWHGWSIEALFDWKEYLMLGIPGFLGFMIDLSFFEIGVFSAGHLGKIELGVMSVSQEILFICFQFNYGIGIAGNIHIGQLLGANQPVKAKNFTKAVFFLNGLSSVLMFLIVYTFSNYIPLIFSQDSEIVTATGKLLQLIAVVHVLDGTQGMCCGVLKAVGAQLYSSIIMFISFYVIGSGASFYLLFNSKLAVTGFYVGILIAEVILVLLQVLYILKIDWAKMAQQAHDYNVGEDTKPFISNLSTKEVKLIDNQAHKTKNTLDQLISFIIRLLSCITVFVLACAYRA